MLAIAGTIAVTNKRPDKVASQAIICPALSLSCAEIDRCPHVIFSSAFCVILYGLRLCCAQSHSDDSHVHAIAPHSARALTHSLPVLCTYECPTMILTIPS